MAPDENTFIQELKAILLLALFKSLCSATTTRVILFNSRCTTMESAIYNIPSQRLYHSRVSKSTPVAIIS
ncbi:hypothetical protein BDZ91DRAFT_723575 [Kalaharituber pfeilii]|nr:hypothetical protein BDZ91DRAFT_723575 [Kalaharituber pfeilii]